MQSRVAPRSLLAGVALMAVLTACGASAPPADELAHEIIDTLEEDGVDVSDEVKACMHQRVDDFQLTASVVPVESYDAGASMVLDGSANVLFGDRQILVETAASNPSASNLIVLDRLFTSSPIALAVARNDDDFRLVVDRSLSRFFSTGEFRDLYAKWFGAPDDAAAGFFRQSAVPD